LLSPWNIRGLKENPNLARYDGESVVAPWRENGGGSGSFHLPQFCRERAIRLTTALAQAA
jgi:hypothetical protein